MASPAIGQWVRCTLDGMDEHKAQVTRIISDEIVDVAIYDDNGSVVRGVTELELAKGLNRAAPNLWWP